MQFYHTVVTYNDYLRRMLSQILDSHHTISDIEKTSIDIDTLRKEMYKMRGALKSILSSIPESAIQRNDFGPLCTKIAKYLEEYDFDGELNTLGELYAEDVMRINNMRIKIRESLQDRKMTESIKDLLEEL